MQNGRPDNPTAPRRLLVAGGGTGGHLFPAVAVAREFLGRHPDNRVHFVVAGKPFEKRALERLGFAYTILAAEGLKGRGRWRQLLTVFKIPAWVWRSQVILKAFGPDVVLGAGSYTAGPVALAAWLKGIRIVLQEQNILPGITNRSLAPLADRIYVAFDMAADHFPQRKVRVTGNPVREEIVAASQGTATPAEAGRLTVLVLGGSQGAHAINAALIDGLPQLRQRSRLRFIHQTGAADEAAVREAYRQNGVEAEVAAFFDGMGRLYAEADLVVCRAGATTLAEITVAGRPSILIPYPHAADDHQRINAQALVEGGAAPMILEPDLEGSELVQAIDGYLENPAALAAMAAGARSLGRPDAARDIVDDLCRAGDRRTDGP
jgi:UDP-N-acetylglucosamine--N-acetylmuramyl-(pentapeptide) pyrophosphoryl-undecaprenol N-acetylglucosamine transferase